MTFLKWEVKGAKRLSYVRAGLEDPSSKKALNAARKREEVPNVASLLVGQREACIFCQKVNHDSAVCFKTRNMSLDEKRKMVKDSRSCFACLKKGHGVKMCRSQIQCTNCGRRHYHIMCPGLHSSQKDIGDAVQGSTEGEQQIKVTTTNMSGTSSTGQFLMKTVRVPLTGVMLLRFKLTCYLTKVAKGVTSCHQW